MKLCFMGIHKYFYFNTKPTYDWEFRKTDYHKLCSDCVYIDTFHTQFGWGAKSNKEYILSELRANEIQCKTPKDEVLYKKFISKYKEKNPEDFI